MTKEQAVVYLRFSGFSDEQIKAIEGAFSGWGSCVPISEKAEGSEDAISRQAELNGLASIAKAKARSDAQKALMGRIMFFTEKLPPVNPQKSICPSAGIDCEDCPAYEKKSEWEHDHEILKAYSDGANEVLDKIKAEIESKYESIPDTFHHYETGFTDALEWVLSIIDKYKAEGSEE